MLHCTDVLEDHCISDMEQAKASFGWTT